MGYKAFKKGMICRGKQYAENTVYEENGADRCCNGGVMHYCETPMDVLDYYPLVDENGNFSEFAEVEPLDKVLKAGNKRATKKLRIGAKLSFRDFIKAAVSVVVESTRPVGLNNNDLADNGGDGAKIGSSGDCAQIGSSGYGAQIGSSGYGAQIGSSGNGAKIGSSGYTPITAPKGVRPEIGNSAFREQRVDLSSKGVRARPRRRCFLVWGPLPAPRTRTPRAARTQPQGRRNLRQLSGPGR